MLPIVLFVQIIGAYIIQQYSDRWFFFFCFVALAANIYWLYNYLVRALCVINDGIVLRFLASEMKAGITEDDLKAAYEKRLALVGPEEAKRIRKRRYMARSL